MRTRVERRTVNLPAYPDLVVIYLGMRVNRIAGSKTMLGFGPKISSSAAAQPEWATTARDNHLLVISNACWHAPILA